ncbi:IclR family transcriptional regulator [Nakamurella flava]|uniref:IclR family transcriptional regulator n=1 Tax=Nakamurella flava TaxID=2576308 RepID=A0A4U6QB53_9ACTN|nr:IclR family transcriptional regulator [Nakamurella flava]TKV57142.1 IclR family transcriptional regulator [Nakamurella flava]
MEPTNGPGGLQSVDRALQVLELLAAWGSGGVTELAAEIGVHKSTVFRLLGALEARDLVEQTVERGKYRLGFGVVRLARRVNVHLEISEQAQTVTEKLAHRVGESINVAVARENFAVNVVQSRGQASVASHNWIGQLTPLHATSSGKVLLAHMDKPQRTLLLGGDLERFTERTHVDLASVEGELSEILDRGYATTFGELEVGLNAVAVPVRGEDGSVVAALSASGPAYRLTAERIEEILPKLRDAGVELSRRLGHWGNAA